MVTKIPRGSVRNWILNGKIVFKLILLIERLKDLGSVMEPTKKGQVIQIFKDLTKDAQYRVQLFSFLNQCQKVMEGFFKMGRHIFSD